MTIVTTHYRYKRPPRKRKAVALEGPAVVTVRHKRRVSPEVRSDGTSAPADQTSAIITARRPKVAPSFPSGRLPETEEEHRRRADAADAMWREMVRRVRGG
jgi:hypothetical protein